MTRRMLLSAAGAVTLLLSAAGCQTHWDRVMQAARAGQDESVWPNRSPNCRLVLECLCDRTTRPGDLAVTAEPDQPSRPMVDMALSYRDLAARAVAADDMAELEKTAAFVPVVSADGRGFLLATNSTAWSMPGKQHPVFAVGRSGPVRLRMTTDAECDRILATLKNKPDGNRFGAASRQ
ncbi:MAG: hypothetical protein BIFFINMI_02598 [Phycisphaerae bacterium]|nr:hypothetical protein [Phycisphaerae bacterium]